LFYYRHIELIQEPEKDESISASEATLGNVLHAIMHRLYTPYIGQQITNSTIEGLLRLVNDDAYWASLAPLQDLKGDRLAEKVVRTYVNNVLHYDYTCTPFQLLAAEQPIRVVLPNNMTINGTLDRLDRKADIVRVVDYKTGKADLNYSSMADVFGVMPPAEGETYVLRKHGNTYILQTMLYCWILSEQYPNLTPHIYATRRLSDATTCSNVYTKGTETPVTFDEQIKKEFANELDLLISEILNPDIPFHPTEDSHSCEYCPFALLCRK
jgi:RecB family exonuclease